MTRKVIVFPLGRTFTRAVQLCLSHNLLPNKVIGAIQSRLDRQYMMTVIDDDTDTEYFMIFTKPHEIPNLLDFQIADFVICGSDIQIKDIMENYTPIISEGFGKQRISLIGLPHINETQLIEIVTPYPHIVSKHLSNKINVKKASSSLELYPQLPQCSTVGIVDVVETGNSIRINGLEEKRILEPLQIVAYKRI